MKYISITQIDAVTGVICTQEFMWNGPAYPQLKGFVMGFNNTATHPTVTPHGSPHATAPLFFGTCDDDANLTVPGVIATHTAEEYQALRMAEYQARKPFPSWVGNEESMSWEAPVPAPDVSTRYYWDEATTSWATPTSVEQV